MKSFLLGLGASVVLFGCDDPKTASPAPSRPPAAPIVQQRPEPESLDQMYQRKWDRAKKDFQIPEHTPYDANVDLRRLYLEGVREGLDWAMENKGNCGIECFFPDTQEERAWVKGYDAGRSGPMNLRGMILKEIQEELLAEERTRRGSGLPDLRQHLLDGDTYAAAGSLAFMVLVKEIEGADQVLAEGLLRASSERRGKILAAMWGYGAPALSARRTREALRSISLSDSDEKIRVRAGELAGRFDRK